jgi:hypothetical protein
MKAFTIAAASLLSATFGWADEPAAVPLVGLVHLDEYDIDTYYNYLAAVPVFRFWDAARFREMPLLTDDVPITNRNDVAASHLVVVGEAAAGTVAEVRTAYGVPAADVSMLENNAVANAGIWAEHWARARDVVAAPYTSTGDKAAVASASYAAALASALNAPLLYTYPERAPYETLSALRRLGAKNVFVVDFDGSCSDDVLAKLAPDRLSIAQRFVRPNEVASFVKKRIRQSKIRHLPRET